jgi:hypothetical protein
MQSPISLIDFTTAQSSAEVDDDFLTLFYAGLSQALHFCQSLHLQSPSVRTGTRLAQIPGNIGAIVIIL